MLPRRNSIGEFEELVLIITASLESDAYGVTITNEFENKRAEASGLMPSTQRCNAWKQKDLSDPL